MEKTTGNSLNGLSNSPTDEELKAARKVLSSFLVVLKNYNLYPETHINLRKSIENIGNVLDSFLNEYAGIRFYFEKDRIFFKGKVIHQEASNEDGLASLLFRDGIQWIEFQKNITMPEIIDFLKILRQYKILQDEPESDIVTALWEENFPHIGYEAKDIYWDAELIVDFYLPTTSCTLDDRRIEAQVHDAAEKLTPQNTPVSIAASAGNHTLWKLTPEEMRQLRRMVYQEENRENPDDVLDILMVILEEQQSEEDFKTVLTFTTEEFQDTLRQGNLELVLKLLKYLSAVRQSYKTEKPWAVELVDNFFREISCPPYLEGIFQIEPGPEQWSPKQIKIFSQIIRLLSPSAILTLGPMLLLKLSPPFRRLLTEAIIFMAGRDIEPMVQLLGRPEKPLILELIHILRRLRGNKATQILLRLIHHKSVPIRQEALKALVNQSPRILKKIFPLIDDDDDATRQVLLDYLGQRRNPAAEELLLDYLENRRFKRADEAHLLACYRALGRCGSALSIPFLQSVLLNKAWKSFLGAEKRTVERHGSAIALFALNTEESESILEKASKSMFSGIRQAYQKAAEERK